MSIDVNRVIAQLADAGFDLVHAFDAHAIGALARAEAALEEHERATQRPTVTTHAGVSTMTLSKTLRPLARWTRLATGPRLGLLVGNTRAMWPHFVAARESLPVKDPLDAYVERTIEGVLVNVADGADTRDADTRDADTRDADTRDADTRDRVFYAHRAYDDAFLPFQALAIAAGFGAASDGGLVVHPIYGPWFALRAVITLDGDPPSTTPIPKPCACTGACQRALDVAIADTSNWRAWLAVRDACSLRAWRYSDEQIHFHYASAWPAAGQNKPE